MSRKTGRNTDQARRQTPAGDRRADAAPKKASVAAKTSNRAVFGWLKWLVWGGATLAFFWAAAAGLERQITWYLAVDQFGYLTFANDLLHGRVFHEWAPLKALEHLFPPRTDVLVQTYVYDQGRLYCRYSPGFPILLAGWIGILGPDRAHYLNPTLYLVLLGVATAFQWRVFRSPWRAMVGTALIALFPTMMHLWGLTLTRDLSAHVFGLIGLFVLLPAHGRPMRPGRLLVAGLALGFCAAIRPDAVLYLIPATCMLALRWWQEPRQAARWLATTLGAMALGFLLGASPILAYNWAATGNPLIPTQGMELPLLPKLPPPKPKPPLLQQRPAAPADGGDTVGYPSPGWRGGTYEQVQGGGLRLKHLATTLPGNWRLTMRAYTPLLFGAAVWGAVVAIVMRPMLAAAAVPYAVFAFLFFSCWPRPDLRYLIGVFVFLPMLVVEGTLGTLDLVRVAWRQRRREVARGLAILAAALFLLGAWAWAPATGSGNLPARTFFTITLITGIAAALAAVWPGRRVVAVAAPVLMLALVWCKVSDVQDAAGRRAPFQHAQVLEARANMQRLLEPNSVVITAEEVGRPAENIAYYGGRGDALYLTDLERWKITPAQAALPLLAQGMRPYLFIPSNQPGRTEMLDALRAAHFTVELVADIPAQRAMAHFVAAPFHRGVRMELYRISFPVLEDAMRELRKQQKAAPPATAPDARSH